MKIKSTVFVFLATSSLISACSNISDSFKYEKTTDEFTSEEVTRATISSVSDSNKDTLLALSLQCKKSPNVAPDPFPSTTISFTITDRNGNPIDYTDLSVRFDDKSPSPQGFMRTINTSKYSNVSEHYYARVSVFMLESQADRITSDILIRGTDIFPAFTARVSGGSQMSLDQVSHVLIKSAVSAKSLMIRFETSGGVIHTSRINIDSNNYRKVLEDCGWNAWLDNWEKNNASAEAAVVDNDRVEPVASQTDAASTEPAPLPMAAESEVETREASVADGAINPSFDCSRASTKTEMLICGSRELASLDVQLSRSYNMALADGAPMSPSELKSDQRSWIRGNNQCSNESCLAQRYRDRIKFLNSR